jgi:hypothetical protein
VTFKSSRSRGRRDKQDPALNGSQWRKLREIVGALRLPCSRCGGSIDYAGRYRLPNGQVNPKYYVLGHRVSRVEARAAGWSEAMINAPNICSPSA